MMDARDWLDMASVYQAGADQQRDYELNIERQQQADALEAMAARCEQLAYRQGMTPGQLAEAERAYRQRLLPAGSRAACREFVPADGDGPARLCRLHHDHVLDGTAHRKA